MLEWPLQGCLDPTYLTNSSRFLLWPTALSHLRLVCRTWTRHFFWLVLLLRVLILWLFSGIHPVRPTVQRFVLWHHPQMLWMSMYWLWDPCLQPQRQQPQQSQLKMPLCHLSWPQHKLLANCKSLLLEWCRWCGACVILLNWLWSLCKKLLIDATEFVVRCCWIVISVWCPSVCGV